MPTLSANGSSGNGVPGASARFRRAAAAEREALERTRERLARRRDTVLAALEPIDRAIGELDHRIELLERLGGETQRQTPTLREASTARAGSRVLRGPAIRETA